MARVPDVERDIQRRTAWILSHPAELEREAELAACLGEAKHFDPPAAENHQVANHDLEAALRSVDLRTIDLSPARPRAGIERHLREALGIRPNGPIDVPLPPMPGQGLDGPDLSP